MIWKKVQIVLLCVNWNKELKLKLENAIISFFRKCPALTTTQNIFLQRNKSLYNISCRVVVSLIDFQCWAQG